jgi:endogenous inhibitor of DNA gyrase (YacG/DUF329 family)
MRKEPEPTPETARCPICRRPVTPRYRPFCSARCRDADLIRWLDGRYAIPSQERPDELSDGADEES